MALTYIKDNVPATPVLSLPDTHVSILAPLITPLNPKSSFFWVCVWNNFQISIIMNTTSSGIEKIIIIKPCINGESRKDHETNYIFRAIEDLLTVFCLTKSLLYILNAQYYWSRQRSQEFTKGSSCITACLGHEVLLLLVQHTHLQAAWEQVMLNTLSPSPKKTPKQNSQI